MNDYNFESAMLNMADDFLDKFGHDGSIELLSLTKRTINSGSFLGTEHQLDSANILLDGLEKVLIHFDTVAVLV